MLIKIITQNMKLIAIEIKIHELKNTLIKLSHL